MKKKALVIGSFLMATSTFAQETTGYAASSGDSSQGWIAIAAAIAIGCAVLGGTLAQGKASAVALDGIARNPSAQNKIFVPLVICLALIESLFVLSWVISNNLVGLIGQ